MVFVVLPTAASVTAASVGTPSSSNQLDRGGRVPSGLSAADVFKKMKSSLLAPTLSSSQPWLNPDAAATPDVDSDVSFVLRQVFNNMNYDSPAFAAEGMTTGFNSVMGAIAAVQAYQSMKKAVAISADAQATDAKIDFVRGILQSVGGAGFVAYRPLSIITSIHSVDASSLQSPSLLGRVTYMVGTVASGLMGGLFASLAVLFGRKLKRTYSFRSEFFKDRNVEKLGDKENVKKIAQFFHQRIQPTEATKLTGSTDKKVFHEKAVETVANFIRKTIDENNKLLPDNHVSMSKEASLKLAEKVLAEFNTDPQMKETMKKSLGLNEDVDFNFAELLGVALKQSDTQEKHALELQEQIGGKAVSLAQQMQKTDLINRLDSTDPIVSNAALKEAQEMILEAKQSMKENLAISWLLVPAAIAGLVASVLGLVPALAALASVTLASGIMMAVSAFGMLLVDGFSMKKAQEGDGPAGTYDKHLLALSTVFAIVSLSAVIVLASVFSVGTIPLAVSLVIGALWIGNNIHSFYKIHCKQQKHETLHPTLTSLKARTSWKQADEKLDAKFIEIFKRLPKGTKNNVRSKLELNQQDGKVFRDDSLAAYDNDHQFGKKYLIAFFDGKVLATNGHQDDLLRERLIKAAHKLVNQHSTNEHVRKFYDYLKDHVQGKRWNEVNVGCISQLQKIHTGFSEDLKRNFEGLVYEKMTKKSLRSMTKITKKQFSDALDYVMRLETFVQRSDQKKSLTEYLSFFRKIKY
jgi:hypothetical protein